MKMRAIAITVVFVGLLAGPWTRLVLADTPTPVPATSTPAASSPTPATTGTPAAATSTPTPDPTKPFVVRIPTALLDIDFPTERPDRNTGAKLYRRITAFVDGQVCDSADLISQRSGGFVILQIGLPNQPAACKREGATVTFAAGPSGEWPMLATFPLQRGGTVMLERLGVQPPQTGSADLVSDDGQAAKESAKENVSTSTSRRLVLAVLGASSVFAGLVLALKVRFGSKLAAMFRSR